MKNLKLLWVFFAAMVVACTHDAENSKKENKALLVSGTTQVIIGEEVSGVLSITYANITLLKNELKTYWGLSNLNNLRLQFKGNAYWLSGDGDKSNGEHVDWSILMEKQLDDIVMLIDGGTQNCTARECCNGCKLNEDSETEGNCNCTTPNPNIRCEGETTVSCKHSVSTGLGSDQDYVDMVNALDSAS
ncbi:MAG: hypothetical protein ACPGLV_08645 [Bacteroidia bacterium]